MGGCIGNGVGGGRSGRDGFAIGQLRRHSTDGAVLRDSSRTKEGGVKVIGGNALEGTS